MVPHHPMPVISPRSVPKSGWIHWFLKCSLTALVSYLEGKVPSFVRGRMNGDCLQRSPSSAPFPHHSWGRQFLIPPCHAILLFLLLKCLMVMHCSAPTLWHYNNSTGTERQSAASGDWAITTQRLRRKWKQGKKGRWYQAPWNISVHVCEEVYD